MTIPMRQLITCFTFAALAAVTISAQTPAAVQPQAAPTPAASGTVVKSVAAPSDYVIGPDDVLSVLFWRDKEMSADVVVRPDGKITLPLINEVAAAGLTPEQLREQVEEAAHKFVSDATASVVLKEINSRKVFITGAIERPGSYPLNIPTTVLQMIATAGGLKEYADASHIVVMRTEGRVQTSFVFDYKSVIRHKKLQQNIQLKPGDTVVVP